jgi:hypothetical protein
MPFMRENVPQWILVQVGKSRYRVAERDRVIRPGLWCYRTVTDNLTLDDAKEDLARRQSEQSGDSAA